MSIIRTVFLLFPLYIIPQSTVLIHPGNETDEAVYLCQELIHGLAKYFHSIQFLTTRTSQEHPNTQATATFANRINPELYISIHLTQASAPCFHIYTYLQNKTDLWRHTSSSLDFIPLNKAHMHHAKNSLDTASLFLESLKTESLPCTDSVCSFPFKPLAGIQCVSFAVELGIPELSKWHPYKEQIHNALIKVIMAYQESA